MPCDTESKSRNVLASPLGEEGHEVAKGVQANWIHRGAPRPVNPVRRHPAKSVWTVVRMVMIFDVDVTAEGGIIKLIAPYRVRCASLRSGGRRLAVRTAMEHPIGALPRTPFPASRDFPSRGNEKIGGTGYCGTYDTDSQSRNVLASPLGEEGHEVAKGWTVVILIMILDVDVTAERRHYNTNRPVGATTTLGLKGRQT